MTIARRRVTGLVILLALVAVSCSSGSTTATSTTATSPTATSPAGCTAAPASGATSHELTAGGVESSYLLYVPPSAGAAPAPVVLDFHGLGSNGIQQVAVSRFRTLADDEGFLVVNPRGTPAAGNSQNSWELPSSMSTPTATTSSG